MKSILAFTLCALSLSVFAESGTCTGTTASDKKVVISYFTNGYSDDNIDYYAKITLGTKGPATYALYVDSRGISGDATRKSIEAGLDFGQVALKFSKDKKAASGILGKAKLSTLACSYKED